MPARLGLQHIPSDIKPVMLRPQHHYPSPTSGPRLSCSYVKPVKLRLQLRDIRQHALYALAPRRYQLRSSSNIYPRDVQGRCNPYTPENQYTSLPPSLARIGSQHIYPRCPDTFHRASRECSGSNDSNPNAHHEHPKNLILDRV